MKKEDRRIRLTKRMLRESLIELLDQQPITKITVTMLCEKADVSRGSFYKYYQDAFDLLESIEKESLSTFEAYLSKNSDFEKSMTETLEFVSDNSDVFRILLGENGTKKFKEDILLLSYKSSDSELKEIKNQNPNLYSYIQHFAVYSCLSVIQIWMDEGMPETPENLAKILKKLLYQGIESLY